MITISGVSLTLSLPVFLFGSTTVQSVVCDPVAAPTITAPLSSQTVFENSATTVRGLATPGAKVDVFVGSAKRAEVTVPSNGKYSVSTGSLTTLGGTNIKVVGRSACETVQGQQVQVVVKARPIKITDPGPPPVTTFTSPVKSSTGQSSSLKGVSTDIASTQSSDDASNSNPPKNSHDSGFSIFLDETYKNVRTSEAKLYISGDLSQLGIVKVYRNDTLVAESSQNDTIFGFDIPLSEGKNSIRIIAISADGERAEREFIAYRGEVLVLGALPRKLVLSSVTVAGVILVVGTGWWLMGAIRRQRKSENDASRGVG